MSTTHTIDNEGIGGGPFLTLAMDNTANKFFTQQDIDNNNTACCIVGNNKIGKSDPGKKLFGKVVWVSTEKLSGTTIPAYAAVQARGIARFKYTQHAPVLNGMVEVCGDGTIRIAPADADIAAGGHLARGQVIAIDTASTTCDVWLG